MSFKVGLPVMKCSLNPSQAVNKKTGKKSKTCSIQKAWDEMNDNRFGRDPSIDKSQTHLNVWMVGNTDDDIPGLVQKEIDRINEERKSLGKKAMRSDTVSVLEIVEKPPMEYMKNLTYDEKVELLKESQNVMTNLVKEWNSNWKIISSVQHHDEMSAHNHTMIMVSSFDEDGIPTMNVKKEFGMPFFNHINKNYPQMMRERGFDIEDCELYEYLSEEQKQDRKLNPKKYGLESYVYKEMKRKELDQQISDLENRRDEIVEMGNAEIEKLEQKINEKMNAPDPVSYQTLQDENKQLKESLTFKDKLISQLEEATAYWKEQAEHFKQSFEDLSKKVGARLMRFFGFEKELPSNEYPDRETMDHVNHISNELSVRNSHDYHIIEDQDEKGKYAVVFRKRNGEYERIDSGMDQDDALSLATTMKEKGLERKMHPKVH